MRSPTVKEKVDFLKKITLSVEAGATTDSMDLIPESSQFEFIFGLGTAGLTPLELELADKREGDEVRFHINRKEISKVFQHLIPPPLNIPEHLDSFYLKLQVIRVIPADQKEVIKALAEIANCDDHCCGH
jgi:hypothetical protein